MDTLVSAAASPSVEAAPGYFAALPHIVCADAKPTRQIGTVGLAARVRGLETNGVAQRVKPDLRRRSKGHGRVWNSNFGPNITSAILGMEVSRDATLVSVLESREDPATGLEWQKVRAEAWMPSASLIESPEKSG